MDRETAASERGLHYVVVAAADKRPLAKGWLRCAASAEEVEAARADPEQLIGHVPYATGLLVVDIDTGKKRPVRYWREAVRDHLGAPLFEVRTRSGGLHLYYRCDQPVGNRNWEGGEIRCAKGYAVLWDEEAVLAALEQIDQVEPVDVSQWPIRYRTGKRRRAAKGRRGQTARVRAALRCIPCSEVSYDEWVMAGMALHWGEAYGCIGDGLELWRDWSATDPDRYKVGECAAKWRGFDAEGGLTLGSLFWLAKRYGWKGCRRRGRRTWREARAGAPAFECAPGGNTRHADRPCHTGEKRKADHNGPSAGAGRSFRLLPRDDSAGLQTSEGLRICADRRPADYSGG